MGRHLFRQADEKDARGDQDEGRGQQDAPYAALPAEIAQERIDPSQVTIRMFHLPPMNNKPTQPASSHRRSMARRPGLG